MITLNNSNKTTLILCILTLANIIVYWQVVHYDYIILDDPTYVFENLTVQKGITLDGIVWALTSLDFNTANWHPLTWLSLMFDWQLYGMNAGGYHFTNLLFHILNTILLFVVLEKMTNALLLSMFVAALFAVHPLHIESVAWISARKDVLCTFFWLLATWSYVNTIRYSKRILAWYALTIIFFMMSLMSKPMAVTFPFVLLLLDFWPLRRIRFKGNILNDTFNWSSPAYYCKPKGLLHLLLEKLPLFILSIISSVITLSAQQYGQAINPVANISLTTRFANAFVAYLTYITKTIYPHDLSIYYPLQTNYSFWYITLGVGLIILLTTLTIYFWQQHPYLVTGWFWYLGTLVPVIGLVQVGSQSMADRYTYIPLTGLFIILSWGLADIICKTSPYKIYYHILSVLVVIILMVQSSLQIEHWSNSLTLFRHTLKVTKDNALIHNGMGVVLQTQGDSRNAVFHLKEAIRIYPNYDQAHYNLGSIFLSLNEYDMAVIHLKEAIHLAPDYIDAHFNLGQVYLRQRKYAEAISVYDLIIRSKPDHAEAHNYRGVALICQNNVDGAIREFESAIRINPNYINARMNLSNSLTIKQAVIMSSYSR